MSDNQLYFIRDENVFLPANKWFEERSIAELPDSNHQYIIASLEDRFQELFEKVNEVKKDFEAATDKIKIAGKIVCVYAGKFGGIMSPIVASSTVRLARVLGVRLMTRISSTIS